MPKFKVVDSVTGNELHAFYTAVDAQDAIEDYEAHDRQNGTYEDEAYKVVYCDGEECKEYQEKWYY